VGDYRREHLFTLRQSLAAYRDYQTLIAECDREIQGQLKTFDGRQEETVTRTQGTAAQGIR
jgi:hypothetical protein